MTEYYWQERSGEKEPCKKCSTCGHEKPVKEFHRNPQTKDGHSYVCKTCACAATIEWKRKNKEKYAESLRSWKERNRERKRENNRRWARDNPEKIVAQQKLNTAIHSGKIPPATNYGCSICSQTASDYHHWSYDTRHTFCVVPLCRECHTRFHSGTLQILDMKSLAIQFIKENENA
jgi:hypothetical protein